MFTYLKLDSYKLVLRVKCLQKNFSERNLPKRKFIQLQERHPQISQVHKQ